MSVASDLEREMLVLINQERTSRGLDPLRLELRLNDAAEDHSDWMLDTNTFNHTGVGGSSPGDRMRDAGFVFSGSWTWAENIAYQTPRGEPGLSDDVEDLHRALMNSQGHRENILNPNVEVIGIGIEVGQFNGNTVIIVTQKFAKTSASLQYDNGGGSGDSGADAPAPEPKFVEPNEGGNSKDNFLVLKKGESGKLDGGAGDDTLVGRGGKDKLFGRDGDDVLRGKGGNDVLKGHNDDDRLVGGGGRDKLFGGSGDDTLKGGGSHDKLVGGSGNDKLYGGGGKDKIDGGGGENYLVGGGGADDFIFKTGINIIRDFGRGNDQISLKKNKEIKSFNDLRKNHWEQDGDDVVVEDGQGNTLTIEDTLLAELDRGDFIF